MRKLLPLFLVFALLVVIVLSGCGASTPQPPTQPPQPAMCSLRVISSCFDCDGTVYLNGFPTGEYLRAFGSVTINNVPCGQVASVYLIDEFGFISKYMYVTPTGPNTIVNFETFF